MATPKKAPAKKGAKLPSKSITFGTGGAVKNGKAAKVHVSTQKQGPNLLKKLSGI